MWQLLRGRTNGAPLGQSLRIIFGPTCGVRAREFIARIETGDDLKVYFKGIERPLFIPPELPLRMLHQVVTEQFWPHDWHRYEYDGTQLEAADVVLDCGAAEGLFSFLAAPRCRFVYALEPLPVFVEAMTRTFADFKNVQILPYALSDHAFTGRLSGQGILSTIVEGDAGPGGIDVKTLDQCCNSLPEAVTYLKADVEGYELHLLKGGAEFIRKHSPKIAMTTYHNPDHAPAIAAFLKSIHPDYRITVKGFEGRVGAPIMLHACRP